MIKKIALVANCPVSHQSMGGGDRIMIEMAKYWQGQGSKTTLFGPPESHSVAILGGLVAATVETSNYNVERLGITKTYLGRTWAALSDQRRYEPFDLIYSASEALPDVVFSIKMKQQHPKSLWVVGFFLKAKNPFRGEVRLTRKFISLFLQQELSFWLMRAFGVDGLIYMGIEEEKFLRARKFDTNCRIWAAADVGTINKVPTQTKIHDACFVGRLSYQKGIDDLLKVWSLVVSQKPEARLSIVGWGYEKGEKEFLAEIERLGLSQNIIYHGFQEGAKKFEIIKSSQIAILPSRYESFGIVFAEALSCGVPVVAYDLPVLKESFGRGVVYVPLGNTEEMSQKAITLLQNNSEVERLSGEGLDLSHNFSWQNVGQRTWEFINKLQGSSDTKLWL